MASRMFEASSGWKRLLRKRRWKLECTRREDRMREQRERVLGEE